MQEIIEDICEKLKSNSYQNEEQVRFSIVARILQNLGWNIWDPKEVYTEFKVLPEEDATRVDLALFLNQYSPPSVFIEIKTVGKIESDLSRIEYQLRDYNRNNTAQFSIITDGQNWRYYYSQTGGEFSQKCFKTFNLLKDDVEDIVLSFISFLSKEEISNGNAKKEAEGYLQLSQKQRVIEDAFPKAKRLVLEPPYPSLPEAIVELVTQQGHSITIEESKSFIKEYEVKKPLKDDSAKRTSIVKGKPHNIEPIQTSDKKYNLDELRKLTLEKSKPKYLFVENLEFQVKDWTDLSVKLVNWLIQKNYLKDHHLPIFTYSKREKYFINLKREHKNTKKDGGWKNAGHVFVDTKYKALDIVKNIMTILETIDMKNLEMKIVLR